jgi:hypothetical protein
MVFVLFVPLGLTPQKGHGGRNMVAENMVAETSSKIVAKNKLRLPRAPAS